MTKRFLNSLKAAKGNRIIAEVKTYSPSYGDLLRGRNPIEIALAYERAGAAALSYITERENYRGNMLILRELCRSIRLPVLRKDFIHSKFDVEKTAEADASAILLITQFLKSKTLELADVALEHDIEPVVEVHSERDLTYIGGYRGIIGINNKDISKLETDEGGVKLTARLAPRIRELHGRDIFIISESGISNLNDLSIALKHADAALIGTAFMLSDNPEELVRLFVQAKFGD
ncbi:indole-3-glycerol-phosphate synthase [Candidatus Caldarchaeum subterraneum]|uniref:indole-3-glycerol-phosphate synthase n=1 Tax=Caldiarchaeum subterraneum TaxID=311458 RepID=E6N6L8_CALS0|nr:indole-3-glycerol-phosphate synthase [Candidatus Caldarchaeum subterraneum]BAJ50781.1 indole-3-glycerol-phosphate synthase [Candidatus Caldarchaeum subterraneum]